MCHDGSADKRACAWGRRERLCIRVNKASKHCFSKLWTVSTLFKGGRGGGGKGDRIRRDVYRSSSSHQVHIVQLHGPGDKLFPRSVNRTWHCV